MSSESALPALRRKQQAAIRVTAPEAQVEDGSVGGAVGPEQKPLGPQPFLSPREVTGAPIPYSMSAIVCPLYRQGNQGPEEHGVALRSAIRGEGGRTSAGGSSHPVLPGRWQG